jgi:hypothetical protein
MKANITQKTASPTLKQKTSEAPMVSVLQGNIFKSAKTKKQAVKLDRILH